MAAVETTPRTEGRAGVAEKPFMTRVRLRAKRRALWMRSLWGGEGSGVEQGPGISHAEVDRILMSSAEMAGRESDFYETDAEARELTGLIREADGRDAQDPVWKWLWSQFGLSKQETDILALCVAAEIEPTLGRVYAYLHDDAGAAYASPWLASCLFQWGRGVTVGPQSPLVRWLIARPATDAGNQWSATAPWAADPHIVLWMTGVATLDPGLGSSVRVLSAAESGRLECVYPAELDSIREFALASRGVAPAEVNLIGEPGAGKRTLAAQVSAALGHDLISADAAVLVGGDVPFAVAVERAIRACRLAHLAGAFLYWQEAEAANPKIWSAASAYSSLVFLGSHAALPWRSESPAVRKAAPLPRLTRSARAALWNRIAGRPAPESIANWDLLPADIASAARLSAAGATCQGRPDPDPGELFVPLACPYAWDDMVLSAGQREHLLELQWQIRLRSSVYEDWGFERLCPLGRGITAMFAGPSGTGKTMAAQVLAGSLGMKLYRVDLSGVMNKYIGETEKRIRRVFDACERANVVLFFDEADALFGQRTQVKDAHDRFANIEIDYLLQRMEQFNGVAILATNRKGDLDKAFLRRIRFVVDFIPPGPTERLAMWQRALPEQSPSGEDLREPLDWQYLSEKLNLTGAEIRSAALGAAFLARAEGTRIGMAHVLHAAQREIGKGGATLRRDGWGGN